MTTTNHPIRLALADTLGSAGFLRKGQNWFRQGDEVVEVLNLQKSQYGPQYYLDYGIWLRALGEEQQPREQHCHVRMRLGAVMSSAAQLTQLLDLEADTPEHARRSALAELLATEFLSFAELCRTTAGLRQLLAAGRLQHAMVNVAAKAVLDAGGG